jgi:Cu(I)/Ag(I) efflux system membrane fusion protein
MFTRVVIEGRPIPNIVHVPREAVVRGGMSNRVVVDMGDGMFESRKVLVGIESGDRVAIRRGISEDERVVVSAQFLIDSESNIDSALERMESSP